MSWRIVIVEQGESLRLKMDNLYIKKGTSEYTLPLADISMVIVSNLDTIITSRILDAFTQYNICFVVCDYKHQPSGIFVGLNTHSRASKIFNMQVHWTDEFKDEIWSYIVRQKLMNQREVLKQFCCNFAENRISLLEEYIHNIEKGDSTNREGHAAKVYFNTLFGNEFTRDDDTDIRNACLNYLYAVVRAYFTKMIVAYGLSGMIGVHHKNEYNNFNLADDLMEPFRPLCDKYILDNLSEIEVFDLDVRLKLIDFLHQKINYGNKNVMIVSVIEKYIISFINLCKTGDMGDLKMPEIFYE